MTAPGSCVQSAVVGQAGIGADDAIFRFTISPSQGQWLWRTFERDGRTRAQGLAQSRKHAAALIIHAILRSRAPAAAPTISTPSRAA
ncbi:hypothetical protein SGCZBJ_01715 [Caulobacter zeae]|uniref:DUF1508 domain-containing protein n=2 Tax=Caulobacter TaxID=75 RepID=A0A2T9IVS3_9CAUL|nr:MULTISPECIES: hypothetical protein [Caulobacter]PLR28693.1 hypothetical protein SGCZBJ_01715 [Caulobacter zeae]PVM70955.1 hypothetical protein DDF65_25360 [Caulobacter radicis]PVM87704.1 hypothetical protein DDF62_16455 [Caulobacter radicis]